MVPPSSSKRCALLQHGLRIFLIVAIISIGLQVLSSFTSLPCMVLAVLGTIFCLLSLWSEVSDALLSRNLPPGDRGLFLVGDTFSFLSDPLRLTLKNIAKHGETFSLKLAYGTVVSMGDPNEISWLWNVERKSQAAGFWPPVISTLLGPNALPTQTGQFHRFLRRMLKPAFTPNAIRSYVADLDSMTKECLEKWSKEGDFLPTTVFKMYALQLFFVSAFGQVDPQSMEQFHDDLQIWLDGFMAVFPLKIPGSRFAKAMHARENMLKTTEALIRKFKEEFPPESDQAKKSLMGRVCYAKDDGGNPMSTECLCDNVITMIFAGHDTTYNSLGTALYYLSTHPEIRDAIRDEVKAFQDPLDYDEMKSAPVLNSFLAECWRIDPPVVGGWRQVVKQVDHPQYVLPKGQLIQYNIFATTANGKVYPEPFKFSIARFLPKDHPLISADDSLLHADNVEPKNYPIFGGGNHSCLGSHFAKLEMRVLLTRMLQKYDLEIRNPKQHVFPIRGWSHEFKLTPSA